MTTKEYFDYIKEGLSGIEGISYRRMMGEYIIYYREKVVGGIYDDRFLVKPTPSAISMMPNAEMQLSYEGGAEMLAVEDVDDKEFLQKLFSAIYSELPLHKRLKRNKV